MAAMLHEAKAQTESMKQKPCCAPMIRQMPMKLYIRRVLQNTDAGMGIRVKTVRRMNSDVECGYTAMSRVMRQDRRDRN